MDRQEWTLFLSIVGGILLILTTLLSGGCGVEWTTMDGAVAYDTEGEITAKSLVVQEESGWLWRTMGWGKVVRVWNAYKEVDSGDKWIWTADSGGAVSTTSFPAGSDGRTAVDQMWNSWNAQIKTGITRPEGAGVVDQEIIQEAKRLLDNSNTEEDNPTND